ncbi:myb family transcription factor PHL5-like [Gastrolobium bilobum]|uniref:myb family transcription factor PHL5-like n=1 Tax=Gastrolobium bilobum TaxID=150636 RepID=UPI002AB17EAE|nr:myb family transcription factor PHL5-like [Gastrolobium bilobum]
MYQCASQMYGTQWESHMGFSNLAKVVGSEQSPCNIVTTPFQTTQGFCANAAKSLVSFQTQEHDQHQIEVPAWCFEFPNTTDSPMLICQASGNNFANTTKQDRFTSQFTSSLYSNADSFLASCADSLSSSEKYSNFQPDNMPFYENFPQERDNDAATDERPHEISFQRNQLASCAKPEKDTPRICGVAGANSSNSASKRALTRKRRIRWTKDLHEPFMMIVNSLGGPEKAKPKAILDMMKSDLLSISHVKSHLQVKLFPVNKCYVKCRSTNTIQMHKALQEGPEEGHRTDGVTELQVKIHMQIEESQKLQLEVQRSIDQQLEMQRDLQMLIEQQNKLLKSNLRSPKNERTKR